MNIQVKGKARVELFGVLLHLGAAILIVPLAIDASWKLMLWLALLISAVWIAVRPAPMMIEVDAEGQTTVSSIVLGGSELNGLAATTTGVWPSFIIVLSDWPSRWIKSASVVDSENVDSGDLRRLRARLYLRKGEA